MDHDRKVEATENWNDFDQGLRVTIIIIWHMFCMKGSLFTSKGVFLHLLSE